MYYMFFILPLVSVLLNIIYMYVEYLLCTLLHPIYPVVAMLLIFLHGTLITIDHSMSLNLYTYTH